MSKVSSNALISKNSQEHANKLHDDDDDDDDSVNVDVDDDDDEGMVTQQMDDVDQFETGQPAEPNSLVTDFKVTKDSMDGQR